MRLRNSFVTTLFTRRVALTLAATLAMSACTSVSIPGLSTDGGPDTTPDGRPIAKIDPAGPVTVAFLAPTSSTSDPARRAALDLVAAAEMAQAERAPANMRLKVYDTKGTPEGAAAATTTAVQDGAAIILGPLFGASTEVSGPIAAEAGLTMLSFSNDVGVSGGNVWVLGRTPGDEMRRLFSYAGSKGVSRIAITHPTNRYGSTIVAEAPAAGSASGVGLGPFLAYERSFQGIEGASKGAADQIRSTGAQGVMLADTGDALRSMAAFLSFHDVSPSAVRYMGLSPLGDERNSKEAALVGAWFVAPDPQLEAAFNDRFAAKLSRSPSSVAGVGYDAVAIAATLLRAGIVANDSTPFDAAALTRGAGFDGATGRFSLTSDGDNRRTLAVMQVTREGSSVLDPAPTGAPGS